MHQGEMSNAPGANSDRKVRAEEDWKFQGKQIGISSTENFIDILNNYSLARLSRFSQAKFS